LRRFRPPECDVITHRSREEEDILLDHRNL
jgi:hypothetical protein